MKKKTLQNILFIGAILVCVINAFVYTFDKSSNGTLSGETAAHVIDVGQGDSILLVSGGQAVLVDAGISETSDRLIKYLHDSGVEELYAAVATHPHADHIGGMAAVINEFPVKRFYMGPETANTSAYSNMLDALEARNITPRVPKLGELLEFDSGASLTFIGPSDDVSADNANNRSLITLFRVDDQSMLLMGDAELDAEKSLIERYSELRCDVLKVGHHGSDTASSPEFLQLVKPKTAVISCGLNNDYGHPSQQTLDNLSAAGVTEIHITAQEGSVVIPFLPAEADKEEPE